MQHTVMSKRVDTIRSSQCSTNRVTQPMAGRERCHNGDPDTARGVPALETDRCLSYHAVQLQAAFVIESDLRQMFTYVSWPKPQAS
jgi:hypothetical protein